MSVSSAPSYAGLAPIGNGAGFAVGSGGGETGGALNVCLRTDVDCYAVRSGQTKAGAIEIVYICKSGEVAG